MWLGRLTVAAVAFAGAARPAAAQCRWLPGPEIPGTTNAPDVVSVFDADGLGPIPAKIIVANIAAAGATEIDGLGSWDGTRWEPLGSGVNSYVHAMLVYNDRLIVAGSFDRAGGIPVEGFAAWDGTDWHSFAPGTNGTVSAMAVYNSDLIVAGTFTQAGSVPLSHIARFDGQQWHPLGTGTNGTVIALTVHDGSLYAGGSFTTAGGQSVQNVARWDGAAWSRVGSALTTVTALGTYQDQLVLAYGTAGISRWNGTAWTSIGGFNGGFVERLVEFGGRLVAAGRFDRVGDDQSMAYIAWWDGTTWSALGTGPDDWVYDMAVYGDEVAAVGIFFTAGGRATPGVALWNGTEWRAACADTANATAPDHLVTDMLVTGPTVYLCGYFDVAGAIVANHIIQWNGTDWSALGTGFNLFPTAMVEWSDNLIVAGDFTTAGGHPARSVARWDGTDWIGMGNGLTGNTIGAPDVTDLVVYRDALYAVGTFTTSGQVACSRAARWDGAAWQPLGSGLSNSVTAAVVFNDELVVAGGFSTAGGKPAMRIARWNGVEWAPLGAGLAGSGSPTSLTVFNDQLIAAGGFTSAGGAPAAWIARWDGTAWHPLGTGLTSSAGIVAATVRLNVLDGDLIVSGAFDHAGGIPVDGVAKWNGTTWIGPAAGTPTYPSRLTRIARFNDEILIAGSFTNTEGIFNAHFARLVGGTGPIIDQHPADAAPCHNDSVQFNVAASGTAPLFYQWRRNGAPLADGPGIGHSVIMGATAPTLSIDNSSNAIAGIFDCLVSNTCAALPTNPATLRVCDADFNCSTLVNSQDFFDFLSAFFAGSSSADSNADGLVNSQDFFDFLAAFFEGC